MVLNLKNMKALMKKEIIEKFDHKNIDKQIEHFKQHPSTSENIALYIYEELKKNMPKYDLNANLLYEVKVHETDKNVMLFRGEYMNEENI